MKTLSILIIKNITIAIFLSLSIHTKTFAWGGRGHHTICDAASFLVQEPGLLEYLRYKPHVMGHLCNIPDIHWKSLGADISRIGSPAHYVDPEILGLKIKDIPLDYKLLVKKYTNTENKFKSGTVRSIPSEFGSNWWRADQFFRRAIAVKSTWSKAKLPKGFKEEQNDEHPYNKSAFEFMVNLGLMGHFVGDNSQPYHTTADYDGYESGHGGIHAYYEENLLGELGSDLQNKVVQEGQRLLKLAQKDAKNPEVSFLVQKTVLEKMKTHAELSYNDIEKIKNLDPVLEPSVLKNEKGMKIKTPAKRKPAAEVAQTFEPLIVTHLARASALLATLWDEAYKKVGRPKMSAYKSYKYPIAPDFIEPDYFDLKYAK